MVANNVLDTYVCAHEKTRFKSQILENELDADSETTAISDNFFSSDYL